VEMMYYYWKSKGISPSVFYNMPKGELTVIRAFYEREIEDKLEMIKNAQGKPVCPMMFI